MSDDGKPYEAADRTRTADKSSHGAGTAQAIPSGVFLIIYHHSAVAVPLSPEKPVVVGRDLPSDVCIPDLLLSRKHARFTLLDDGVLVEDLGSKNGTFVAHQRIRRDKIAVGGDVMLGKINARITDIGMTIASVERPLRVPARKGPESVGEALFGKSPKMRQLLGCIHRVAKTNISVLLHGETGTGKDVIAKRICDLGPRAGKPYKPINCSAISRSLIESELFGYEKNAFTGAVARRQGFFEAADGGTLFLDEIGDLPAEVQAKLLRVLDHGRFYRVGSTEEVQVDVRIIAATHRNLKEMVEEGQFRQDLYYRLNTMVVHIPPLRERIDEIEPLCQRFLAKASQENGHGPKRLSEAASRLLHAYAWPGNIRELKNVIERAAALAEDDLLRPEDLPPELGEVQPAPEVAPNDVLSAAAELAEKEKLAEVLAETRWNKSAAAKKLGKSISTVQRMVKKYRIKPQEKRRSGQV